VGAFLCEFVFLCFVFFGCFGWCYVEVVLRFVVLMVMVGFFGWGSTLSFGVWLNFEIWMVVRLAMCFGLGIEFLGYWLACFESVG